MPLALYTIKDSGISAIFVIFICAIWPMLLNTAFGVASVRREWLNVARTLEAGAWRTAFRVILPAAAPTIMTGARISIGIAWLVIIAAEMLVGGTGIGYFVWNQWNNLDHRRHRRRDPADRRWSAWRSTRLARAARAPLPSAVAGVGAGMSHAPGLSPSRGSRRRLRRTRPVFRDVWFGVERGEFVALIGHSGCGKTTILNILAGLEAPDAGAIVMDGREVAGPALDRAVDLPVPRAAALADGAGQRRLRRALPPPGLDPRPACRSTRAQRAGAWSAWPTPPTASRPSCPAA